MPDFVKGGSTSTPFGRNEFLRSTKVLLTESYTLAASTVTARTIDSVAGQKILQPGTVLAKITSGTDAGKVGPFQRGSGAAGAAAVNEVQTVTIDATGGTFTLTFDGATTAALAFNAAATVVKAALETLSTLDPGDVTVSLNAAVYTVTFTGARAGTNVPALVSSATALTGGAGTAVVATNPAGSAAGTWVGAASDGRGDPANIVGINLTFLPWQTMDRDVEVSAVYGCTAVQGWCIEYSAAGADIVLTNATADAMRGTKGLDILFK